MTEADAGARRASVARGARLVAVLLSIVVAVAAIIVTVVLTGPPSEQDLLRDAGVIGKRQLLIGVKDDQPGIALLDRDTGTFSGFDIDIAWMIAADLGFRRDDVRFLAIESEDRAKMQARTDEGQFVTVDLVIASYSITDEREQLTGVSFSAPYLTTEQSVITRRDYAGPVDTLVDLRGKRVCSLSTATSESPAARAGVELISKKRISECVDALLKGDVEAVTTDAAILAGFVAQHPEQLSHHDIGLDPSEKYGVNTGDNEALRDLVNLSLYDSLNDPQDHRWEDAYDKHLRPEQPVNLPQQVAVDRQPTVEKVEVRRWPWETAAIGARAVPANRP
ncbi:glutamate transport system substrate-binding protein [Micromonospora pisi]|uniref:Glutamate transport system substrate-binding protein n=1 Tax=Micromonospora pisi TaxID=589240 RepID=A0A495JR31_9ACTN|nr:transporter substrate-binding domain-containing protein [Micromonospora pisi]RKR91437.1 glutamate transport system substrate-binding protein [Micromonospora pisi]